MKRGTVNVTNPQDVAELFNSYFLEIAEKLLKPNNERLFSCQWPQLKINSCNETIFIFPVTETEVEKVTKNLRGKLSTGNDVIPDYVVK